MKKIKWNYAVVRSVFGDYWVGKTKLKADEERIFVDIQVAIQRAEELFKDDHIDFDPDNENDENGELSCIFEDISQVTEETAEEIKKALEKFIVKL
jgi:hypothetical protein